MDILHEDGFIWSTASEFLRSEHFASIKVQKNSDVLLKLDFVNDLVPHFGDIVKTGLFYRTDSILNILSNKLSAIFRFAAKDIADIREIALRENVDWVKAIEEARQKEAGLELTYITQILISMPKSEFDKLVWVKKPDWNEFQRDIEKIVIDMMEGQVALKDDSRLDSHVNEALIDYSRKYTYSDYLKWDDDVRYELIDGVPYAMSAPTWQHQEILGHLHAQLYSYLKCKPCKVFMAPFDVRLNADAYDNTVVQPDIVVICDDNIMMKTGCVGGPDMAIEILSPSTSRMDRSIKFNKYLQAGVREYWLVDPDTKTLAIHILKDGDYITRVYNDADRAPVHVLEDCLIDMSEVFA